LHKALFELHRRIGEREKLLGIISLNYDDVVDEACRAVWSRQPSYCLTSETENGLPLLKLHGSFTWRRIIIYGRSRDIPIMPMGITKNYLAPPYNFIWSRAYELLAHCDALRIIGCSLNQNDVGMIDLLFKAHQVKGRSIRMEIIDFQPPNGGHQIKNNYGFFPEIIEPEHLEGTLIPEETIRNPAGNPFRIWLKAKAERMLGSLANRTRYLKKCF